MIIIRYGGEIDSYMLPLASEFRLKAISNVDSEHFQISIITIWHPAAREIFQLISEHF